MVATIWWWPSFVGGGWLVMVWCVMLVGIGVVCGARSHHSISQACTDGALSHDHAEVSHGAEVSRGSTVGDQGIGSTVGV